MITNPSETMQIIKKTVFLVLLTGGSFMVKILEEAFKLKIIIFLDRWVHRYKYLIVDDFWETFQCQSFDASQHYMSKDKLQWLGISMLKVGL
jgi:hypothetical protein